VRLEAGFVSADRGLVDFLAEVFELDILEPVGVGFATVYRLQSPGGQLKVMVPNRPPTHRERAEPFYALGGLRCLALYVDDLGGIVERATTRGGRVVHGPTDLGAGARMAVLEDPDGNPFEAVQAPSA
jgi:predicted enzyme related to lactoylglutathione lyase